MIDVVRIHMAMLWVVLMLVYLLGDVLRIFSGDFKPGEIEGVQVTQAMWMGIAVMMLIPILMVFFSMTVPHPIIRWMNILVAGFFFVFNFLAVPTYHSAYDKFLIIVGLIFNIVTIWYAWRWA